MQQQAPTAANTFQQAFSQAGLPFNQAIGQQAAQFAAALAQAQQASHLLPQQINPAIPFPAGQVRVTEEWTSLITDGTSCLTAVSLGTFKAWPPLHLIACWKRGCCHSYLSELELKRRWCLQIPQGFPLAGQINQANYAQFAAVLAQQAARQRQAQELVAQQAQRAQQVKPCIGAFWNHNAAAEGLGIVMMCQETHSRCPL